MFNFASMAVLIALPMFDHDPSFCFPPPSLLRPHPATQAGCTIHYIYDTSRGSQLCNLGKSVVQAASAGSWQAVETLCDALVELPEDQWVLALPAFFANLDAQRIPSPSELDTCLSLGLQTPHIDCAYHALGPVAGCMEWIDFLYVHWYYLPMTGYISRGDMCVHHVVILLSLCKGRDMLSVIRVTPGVLRIVAAAWNATIGDRTATSSVMSRSPAARLGLAVETVSLLVKGGLSTSQFDDIPPNADLPITPSFFEVCNDFFKSSWLQDALRSLGFVAPLISALSAIIPATISSRPSTIEMALLNLIALLGSSADVALALKSGFLDVIVTIASADVKGREHMPLIIRLLLQELLPQALVHYEVLVELHKCFEDSVALATRSKIDASPFSQHWTDFCILARKRLIFLKSWEVRSSPSRSACVNSKCGKIDVKRKFRTCSGCRSVNYCSKKCQLTHWRSTHRNECDILRSQRFGETHSPRAKSFLRALLDADYAHAMVEICAHQVLFMHRHPEKPFVTQLNYLGPWDPMFKVIAAPATAARSGRTEMHVVFRYEGPKLQKVSVPMYLATSAWHDQLRRLATMMPPGLTDSVIVGAMKQVLKKLLTQIRSEIVFTH